MSDEPAADAEPEAPPPFTAHAEVMRPDAFIKLRVGTGSVGLTFEQAREVRDALDLALVGLELKH